MLTGAHTNAASHADGPRLLADIGGTNARFALETGPGQITQIRTYPAAAYPGLAEVLKQYLKDTASEPLHHAAIAIANPINGDQIRMTNHNWSFSIEAVRRELGFDTLLFINDFTALAMALPALTDAQRAQIGGGAPRPDSAIGLLGPGTGLGVSGLIPCCGSWIALNSEGGHTSFSPLDEREDFILRYARKQWPHVSFERIVAGPGLEIIYRALAERNQKPVADPLSPAVVVELAHNGEPLATEAVDCFCGILGGFAGNLALTLGAFGGIYLGGGVVLKLGDLFMRSPFRERFEAKGRLATYLAKVPVYLITAEYPAFLGVSRILNERLSAPAMLSRKP